MGVRIKPAFSLSVILLIAFGLQLVAVLTAPVTKALALAQVDNVKYGVFGYCSGSNECSKVGLGYDLDFSKFDQFTLPSSARQTLSKILIAHVISAGFTLILLVMTLFAHLHSASHSTAYLCVLFFLAIPTFLLSLLSFLVDILLFNPHLGWGGWIVLGATVLLLLYIVLLLFMRCTLGRKNRESKSFDNSELHNLNAPITYVPSNELTEKYSNPSHNFQETKYNAITGHESINEEATSYRSGGGPQPFIIAQQPTAFSQNQNQNQASNNSYRSYPEYRNTSPIHNPQATARPANNYTEYTPRQQSPVRSTNSPQRRQQASEGIVPAGTYDNVYQDAANMDSYSEFGASVVSVPKIYNPAAVPGNKPQQNPASFAQQSRRPNNASSAPVPAAVATSAAQDAEPTATTRMLPKQSYENLREDDTENNYEPPRSRWRQYAPPSAQHEVESPGRNVTQQPARQRQQPNLSREQEQYLSDQPNTSVSALRNAYLDDDDDDDVQYVGTQYSQPAPSYRTNVTNTHYQQPQQQQQHAPNPGYDSSYLHAGAASDPSRDPSTSPAISDSSHFTSISQREPNPRYYQQQQQGPPPPLPHQLQHQQPQQPHRPQQHQQSVAASKRADFVLDANPDFKLPGMERKKYGGAAAASSSNPKKSALNPGFGALDGPYGASRGV